MIFKILKSEIIKLKHSPVWLAFLIMPTIPAFLGTVNYLQNVDILQGEWYSLWTQHTLFTCYFFLPIMIGVYCAYQMRLEHNNHNLNKMMTMPINRSMFFISKLITVSAMILFSEIWIGVLFVLSGKIVGMNVDVPYGSIITWCLFGTLGGIVMASTQLMLSIYIKSFALPVGIAFAGGLSGLLFLAKGYGHIWPYSLMAYGMNSNSPQQMMKSGYLQFTIICVAFILLFTIISSLVLSKKDI